MIRPEKRGTWKDVRVPADSEDFETTESQIALPPVEFSVSKGTTALTFSITDRQFPAQRGPTMAYRIYFLPAAFAMTLMIASKIRLAGSKVASLLVEVKAPGRGAVLTVTDTQFFNQKGWFYCVGVNRRGLEAPPEHILAAP